MNNFKLKVVLLVLIGFALPSLVMAANAKIGMVLAVRGAVYAKQPAAGSRRLHRRSAVFLQDTITSKNNSWAQLRLEDGTLISIHPNTEFLIEAFRHDKKRGKKQKFVGKLVKGTLVGLSSQGRAADYQLKGSMTTITLRGAGVVFSVLEHKENVGLFAGQIKVQSECPGKAGQPCQRRIMVLRNTKHNNYQTVEVKPTGAIKPHKGVLIQPIPIPQGTLYKMHKNRMKMLKSIYDMLSPKPTKSAVATQPQKKNNVVTEPKQKTKQE